ncbi:chordin-like isoform X1 [Montipora capricornis]|uniref:chordin-like isoform X1 n=2 Tax=Montipora capricornis TaxID=246305 RepID=UPI0035F167BF
MGNIKHRLRIDLLALLIFVPLCLASGDKRIVRPVGTEYKPVPSKPGGCTFGFRHYELGGSWHPEIIPFGVMFCVICTCNKVSNSEIAGKVSCRNTRDRCPTTSCARPKIEPGHCCASCPDEFVSVLMTPTLFSSRQNGIARAHFTLVHNSLHMSILYEGPRKLRAAAVLDAEGSLIEEINIQRKAINGSQICLVWNQMTPKQIQSLKQEKLSFLLKLKRKNTAGLVGDISMYKAYSEEAYEALLQSEDQTSGALVSFNLARNGRALKIQLLYNGSHNVGAGTKVTIQFIRNPTNNKEKKTVKVVSASDVKRENSNFKAWWLNPAEHSLKWMSRGHLNITVILNTADQLTQLTGRISIKRTCNSIVSQLSGRDAPRPTMTGASGYASFEIDNKGQVHYQIFLSGLINPVEEITLQATSNRRNVKRVARLPLTVDEHGRAKVSGVWERPSFLETCWLFNGNMYLNVRTEFNSNGDIHGKLKQFPYNGHHLSYHDPPVLLSGNEVVPRIQTGAAGQAWFLLDKNCALHYHLMLSGLDRGRRKLVTAELQGFADFGEVPQPYDEHVHLLREFDGEMLSGIARNLEPYFLRNLIDGLVYLQVSSEEVPQGELRSQVLVNGDVCNRRLPQPHHIAEAGTCYDGNTKHYNGTSWTSPDDKCTSCRCQDEEITCSEIKCQRLNCTEAPIVVPHLCCPVCPDLENNVVTYYEKKNRPAIDGCYVKRDRKVYRSGAVWHPYVQPFGYMRCHACTCLEDTKNISCRKVKCPDLNCRNPMKLRMTDCCMRCPDNEDGKSGNIKDKKSSKKGCSFSGSKFKDGQTWQPYFPLFGLSRCITCNCKDGITSCRRTVCPKGYCQNSIDSDMKSCCIPCPGS